jgi:hypothetical protein
MIATGALAVGVMVLSLSRGMTGHQQPTFSAASWR